MLPALQTSPLGVRSIAGGHLPGLSRYEIQAPVAVTLACASFLLQTVHLEQCSVDCTCVGRTVTSTLQHTDRVGPSTLFVHMFSQSHHAHVRLEYTLTGHCKPGWMCPNRLDVALIGRLCIVGHLNRTHWRTPWVN
jgi:hypothetical protein